MLPAKLETRGSQHVIMALKRPFKLLFATPLVTIIATHIGVVYGMLYLLISTFSFVYSDQYGFSEGSTGLSFLPAGLGLLIGVQAFGHIHDYLVCTARKAMGPEDEYRPEVKLNPWIIVPTGLALPIGLFIYGWTAQYQIHWIVPMLGVVVFAAGLTGTTVSDREATSAAQTTDNHPDAHSELPDRLVPQICCIRVGCYHAFPIFNRCAHALGRVGYVPQAGTWLGQQPSSIHMSCICPCPSASVFLR